MSSQGVEETQRLISAANSQQHVSTTYDRLMRQSKKLGQTATQTVDGARQGAKQLFGNSVKQEPNLAIEVDELKKVVAHSREVLASARTVLPFLFPDEICLDRTKITITKRNFFWSSDVIAIRVEDILNVSASVGPLFGSVTVASRVMSTIDHFKIERFWRADAIELKDVIQGYLIARQNGLFIDHLSLEELVGTLRELGREG